MFHGPQVGCYEDSKGPSFSPRSVSLERKYWLLTTEPLRPVRLRLATLGDGVEDGVSAIYLSIYLSGPFIDHVYWGSAHRHNLYYFLHTGVLYAVSKQATAAFAWQ